MVRQKEEVALHFPEPGHHHLPRGKISLLQHPGAGLDAVGQQPHLGELGEGRCELHGSRTCLFDAPERLVAQAHVELLACDAGGDPKRHLARVGSYAEATEHVVAQDAPVPTPA